MALRDGNDNIAELLKQACPPAAASPEFKAALRHQLGAQAAVVATASPKPLWQQPFVWIPAAAASAVAVALLIFFVAFQSVPPTVTTRDATSIQSTTATLHGRLNSLDESESVEVSFEWGPTTDYGNETMPELRTETGEITASLSGLRPNTTYHFRLKVASGESIKYGPDMQFTTGPASPVATTGNATNIKTTSATLRGSLVDLGSAANVSVSFEWGLTPSYGNETTAEPKTETGKYSADLSGLAPNTTYHFRAKAVGDDIAYGADAQFTTDAVPPSIDTDEPTSIGTNSARLKGELTSLGTATIVNVSFEWGTEPGSYAHSTADQAMTSTGDFSADLMGLGSGTTYYYRARANGDGDPVYGLEKSFTTLTAPPSVTTGDATNVATTSATLNGNLTSLGTARSVTVSFEWGTASGSYTHTTADQVMTSAAAFSADVTGLAPGITHYYRAKADGDGDPVYGLEESFTTLTAPPAARTCSATKVRCTSATLNGVLDSLGTAESVEVSFEWGISTAYGDETTVQVMTTAGSFNATLTGLRPNTTYRFRAMAIGHGNAYGDDVVFTTGSMPPAQQTWYLSGELRDSVYVAYHDNTTKPIGTVPLHSYGLSSVSEVWSVDQSMAGMTYPEDNWTVHLALSHLTNGHEVIVEIGALDGSGFSSRGSYTFIASGTNNQDVYEFEFSMSVNSFTVPSNGYVATRITVTNGYRLWVDVHVGGSQSYVTSPAYPEPTAPSVTTNAATSVEQRTAILNGYLDDLGSADSVTVYFEWGTTTAYGNEIEAGSIASDGSFSFPLADLAPNTTYHFRAKVVGDGTNYGIDMTFTTLP
jgi:phosphodiesterase/alkaline phosphatase D-like protein